MAKKISDVQRRNKSFSLKSRLRSQRRHNVFLVDFIPYRDAESAKTTGLKRVLFCPLSYTPATSMVL